MAGSIFEEYSTEQAAAESRSERVEYEAHRITVFKIGLGVFVGNLITAAVVAIGYVLLK